MDCIFSFFNKCTKKKQRLIDKDSRIERNVFNDDFKIPFIINQGFQGASKINNNINNDQNIDLINRYVSFKFKLNLTLI